MSRCQFDFIVKLELLASTLILLNLSSVSAQSAVISGFITDSTSNAKLPYSTITLYDTHDSITGGTLSDDHGRFALDAEMQKARRISISYVGYTTQSIVLPQPAGRTIKLGVVRMKVVSTNLNTIEITADVARIEQKFEKTIIRPAKSTTASAINIYEVLRTVPGVAVDASDNIRYRGFTPTIYVNNTPAFLLYPNLESIPTDLIEKIELIDAGMRSGGEGKGGIVNIVFKKENLDGISGMSTIKPSSTKVNKIDNIPVFLNLNFKRQKSILLSNSSYLYSRNDWGYDMTRTFRNSNETDSLVQFTTQTTTGKTNSFDESIGYVYEPDAYTRFTAAAAYDWNRQTSVVDGRLDEQQVLHSFITNQYHTSASDLDQSPSKSVGLSYWHQFDTSERYLESNLYFALSDNTGSFDFTTDYSIINTVASDSIYNHSMESQMNNCRLLYYDFTFYNPISSSMRWNLNYIFDAGLNQHSIVNAATNNLPLPLLFKDDNYNAVFQNLSWRIGKQMNKWKLDAGINLEAKYLNGYYTRATTGSSDTTRQINKWFTKLHPSLTIAYDINNEQNIKLRFAKSARYPQFDDLVNYVYKSTSFDWQTGNPQLLASDFYLVYLGYGYAKSNWYISNDLYYSYSQNMRTIISIPVSSVIWLKQPFNVAKKSSLGLSNAFWIKIKQFDLSVYGDLSAVQFNVTLPDSLVQDNQELYNDAHTIKFDYSVYCQLGFKTGKFRAGSSISFNNQVADYNGYETGKIVAGISGSYTVAEDKFLISAGVKNLLSNLNKNGFHSTNFGIITETRMYGLSYQPMFNLSLKYTFKQGDRGTENVKGMR